MVAPDGFCRHFKIMRDDYYLNISFSIYEYFAYKFDRITVYLNYKEDELKNIRKKSCV